MDEQWYVDRANLRDLLQAHPERSIRQLAEALGRSTAWVKKWRRRFRDTSFEDDLILQGYSRARKRPPERISRSVIDRILDIRDHPPQHLQRTPGPRTILYYLHQQSELSDVRLPRSTSTIWSILVQHQRVPRRPPRTHEPVERPAPLTVWQIDFKDVTTVAPEPEGKRSHAVEIFNVVDTGTSIALDSQAASDFNAETALVALTQTFLTHGLPDAITFDRDPRFVGSWTGDDFPSALLRFLGCLDIQAKVNPPQRPDLNAFVERFHRTQEHECIQRTKPDSLEQTREVAAAFRWHYNHERPNQALSCANQPPLVAFPQLPPRPRLPATVDPDSWLHRWHNKRLKRRVTTRGTVDVGKHRYYLGRRFQGRYAVLKVNAETRQLVVELDGQVVKQVKIKGLYEQLLPFEDYFTAICQDAATEWQLYQRRVRRRRVATM